MALLFMPSLSYKYSLTNPSTAQSAPPLAQPYTPSPPPPPPFCPAADNHPTSTYTPARSSPPEQPSRRRHEHTPTPSPRQTTSRPRPHQPFATPSTARSITTLHHSPVPRRRRSPRHRRRHHQQLPYITTSPSPLLQHHNSEATSSRATQTHLAAGPPGSASSPPSVQQWPGGWAAPGSIGAITAARASASTSPAGGAALPAMAGGAGRIEHAGARSPGTNILLTAPGSSTTCTT